MPYISPGLHTPQPTVPRERLAKRTQLPFVGMSSGAKIPYFFLCRDLVLGKQEWLKPLIPHWAHCDPPCQRPCWGLCCSTPHPTTGQGGTPLTSCALRRIPWGHLQETFGGLRGKQIPQGSCPGAPQGDITKGSHGSDG